MIGYSSPPDDLLIICITLIKNPRKNMEKNMRRERRKRKKITRIKRLDMTRRNLKWIK